LRDRKKKGQGTRDELCGFWGVEAETLQAVCVSLARGDPGDHPGRVREGKGIRMRMRMRNDGGMSSNPEGLYFYRRFILAGI